MRAIPGFDQVFESWAQNALGKLDIGQSKVLQRGDVGQKKRTVGQHVMNCSRYSEGRKGFGSERNGGARVFEFGTIGGLIKVERNANGGDCSEDGFIDCALASMNKGKRNAWMEHEDVPRQPGSMEPVRRPILAKEGEKSLQKSRG